MQVALCDRCGAQIRAPHAMWRDVMVMRDDGAIEPEVLHLSFAYGGRLTKPKPEVCPACFVLWLKLFVEGVPHG